MNAVLENCFKWSKLVHQRVVSKAIMMHSIVNNTAPKYLTSALRRNSLSLLLKEAEEDEPVIVEFNEL